MITEIDKQRVRELVEWATKEIPKMAGVNFDELPDEYKERNRKVAIAILTHPRLALVDLGGNVLPQLVYITEENRENELECARHSQIDMIQWHNKNFLPLAKAIKEVF